MSLLNSVLPQQLSAEQANSLIEFFDSLTDQLWERYGEDIIDQRLLSLPASESEVDTDQHALDFDDTLPDEL